VTSAEVPGDHAGDFGAGMNMLDDGENAGVVGDVRVVLYGNSVIKKR